MVCVSASIPHYCSCFRSGHVQFLFYLFIYSSISSRTFVIIIIITIIVGTISESLNYTTVFEMREIEMNPSQFLSLQTCDV